MADMVSTPIAPIPQNGVLLHIGAFKTGTTSLQNSLAAASVPLKESGVVAIGPSAWRGKLLTCREELSPRWRRAWSRMQRVSREHDGRLVISNENFCTATHAQAEKIRERLLPREKVHILITIRSLSDLLPSTWQQLVKTAYGFVTPYEQWLREVVDNCPSRELKFWSRNDYPRVLRDWGVWEDQANVTVVMVDRSAPDRASRVTEKLLDLPDQTLSPQSGQKANWSQSYPEAELLRLIKAENSDFSKREYRRFLRFGMSNQMRNQLGKQSIPLPGWASTAMLPLAQAMIDEFREAGILVLGDIEELAETSVAVGDLPDLESLPTPMVVAGMSGLAQAAVKSQRRLRAPKAQK